MNIITNLREIQNKFADCNSRETRCWKVYIDCLYPFLIFQGVLMNITNLQKIQMQIGMAEKPGAVKSTLTVCILYK